MPESAKAGRGSKRDLATCLLFLDPIRVSRRVASRFGARRRPCFARPARSTYHGGVVGVGRRHQANRDDTRHTASACSIVSVALTPLVPALAHQGIDRKNAMFSYTIAARSRCPCTAQALRVPSGMSPPGPNVRTRFHTPCPEPSTSLLHGTELCSHWHCTSSKHTVRTDNPLKARDRLL
jgi:hypothetical protein